MRRSPIQLILLLKISFFVTLLILAAIVVQSCAELEIEWAGYSFKKEAFLSSLPTDTTRVRWLKLYRFFEILDGSLIDQIQKMDINEDSSRILSMIEEFKAKKDFESRPDTPERNEWWEEMWGRRAAHCDSFYHSPFFDDYWDERARPVVINGVPENEWWETCSMDPCQTFYMDWLSKGISLAYLDIESDGVVDRMIPSKEALIPMTTARLDKFVRPNKPNFSPFQEVDERLEAALDIISFPEDDSFVVWVSSGVGLKQCVPDSAGFLSFSLEGVVYSTGSIPMEVSSIESPTITIPYPDTTRNIEDLWYPIYFGGQHFSSGEYEMIVTILDNHADNHRGVYRWTLTLPSPLVSRGMSDILIALKQAEPAFGATQNRVFRGEKALMGNPCYFHPGDTLYPYLEFSIADFTPDAEGEYEYTMLGSLYHRKAPKGTAIVELGGILNVTKDGVEDSPKHLGNRPTGKRQGETLIYSVSEHTRNPQIAFQDRMVLPLNSLKGDNLLVISVQDSYSRHYLTAWCEIKIKK